MITTIGTFHIKTKIIFGRGALSSLGHTACDLRASRYLLVVDPALMDLGIVDRATTVLQEVGLKGATFKDIEPEPYLDGADGASDLGKSIGAEVVIGMGGGSAMDTAKAAAAIIINGGKSEDYVGLDRVPTPALPMIMVPTTAGTGAEVTFTAVFTNRETKAKGGINSVHLFPDVAILDPELTVSLPPRITAATGMDALTHAIESVTSRSASVFTESLALTAVRLISGNLRRSVFRGDDIVARENMLLGSLFGGLALANAGVGAAHALAYPLGGYYRVPHGLANAILIPHVMAFNLPAAERSMSMVAESMGESAACKPLRKMAASAVDAVKALCADIGIPGSLSEIGIPRDDIPRLVDGALKVTRPVENNPRYVGKEEAETIYTMAFG